jgi:NADH dehydrogenase [ubiquinone] 1 alpha subcomplex assembly factor 5
MIPEKIFNRNLLFQNQRRFMKNFAAHDFLYNEIAERILENIEALNLEFIDVLEIGGKNNYFENKIKCKNFAEALDDENLDFPAQSFDLIFSNLTFHFINEIPQFLIKVKSLLKPGGIFIASFLGEENLKELRHVLFEVENEVYNAVSPRVAPTIDVKTAAHLLQKAGFLNPISDIEVIKIEYSNPLNLLKDLQMTGQGNIMERRSRKFMTKSFLDKILKKYKELYGDSGKNIASFGVVTIMGGA